MHVSVVVPTCNSEKTIGLCLESLKNQTFKDFEVIIVDSYSKDKTLEIIARYSKGLNIKIAQKDAKPFYARYIGFKNSKGEIIVFLDSDQWFIRNDVLEEITEKMKKYDSLILEEESYNPKTFAEKLFDADRKLLHLLFEEHKDPSEGALYPRVFKREILKEAYDNIPLEIMKEVWAWDDAILWYEYSKLSNKVVLVKDAVYHKEIDSVWKIIKKYYNYGKNAKIFIKRLEELKMNGFREKAEEYLNLIKRKVRFRKGAWKYPELAVKSYLLMALKGTGYKLGNIR